MYSTQEKNLDNNHSNSVVDLGVTGQSIIREIVGLVFQSLGHQTSFLPNTEINPGIRRVFREYISGFISILAQHLNHQIVFPVILGIIHMAEFSQSNLGEFSDITSEDGADSGEDDEDDSDDNEDDKDDSDDDDEDGPASTAVADSDDDDDGDSPNTALEDDPSKKALIYARVSSHKQMEEEGDDENGDEDIDEGSIDGQIEELKEIARQRDLELAHEPITDEAQTGTDFDRDGIQKVFRLAQRDDIGYLLVEKIDRIGRSAPETLYFIHVLQSKCEVRLITASGERDMNTIPGLMHTTLLSLMAEIQNEIRTAKAQKERVRNFVRHHNWNAYCPVVPLGYKKDNDGWLTLDSDEVDVVQEVFETFNDPKCRTYAGVERTINNKYDDILDGHDVKTLLTNPVYVGRPQIPETWVIDLPYDNVVEDESLQIIDEETFDRTQEIIDEKNRKHSSDEESYEIDDFVEEFDLFSVILSSEPATLLHDCGQPMVKDGQKDLNGEITTHRYYCSECDEHRKWPKGYEYRRMKIIHLLLDEEVDFLEALKEAFSMFKE